MKYSFADVKSCRIPGNNSFDTAFGKWLGLKEKEIKYAKAYNADVSLLQAMEKGVRDLISAFKAADLLCEGPFPGSFQSANLTVEKAEEVWNFYEIHRGTPFYRTLEAPTLYQ